MSSSDEYECQKLGKELYIAAAWGDFQEVDRIISGNKGCLSNIIEWRNEKGNTPLYIACAWGFQKCDGFEYFKIAKLLIEHGADVNMFNDEGKSALYISASWGLYDIVQLLLENGANRDVAVNGRFPLDVASYTRPRKSFPDRKVHYSDHEIISKHFLYQTAKAWMKKAMESKDFLNYLDTIEEDYNTLSSYTATDSTVDVPDYIMAIVVYYNHFATITYLATTIIDMATYTNKLSEYDRRNTFKIKLETDVKKF